MTETGWNQQIPKWTLLPLIGGFIWLALGFNIGINVYDEGLAAYCATRILAGDLVYRDFLSLYGPANFYIAAALFKVFGPSLLVLRLYSLVLELLLALVVFALTRRLSSPIEAALATFLVLTVQQPDPGAALTPALLFGFASLWCLLETQRVLLAGALVGLSALFRHDTAAVFIVAGCVYLAMSDAPRRPRAVWRFLGGILIVAFVPYSLLVVKVKWDVLYFDLVYFPLTMFERVRSLPFPDLLPPFELMHSAPMAYFDSVSTRVGFYFPGIALVWLSGVVLRGSFASERDRRPAFLAIVTTLLLLLNHLRVRADIYHLFAPLVASVLAFACALHYARVSGSRLIAGFGIGLYALVAWTPTLQKLDLAGLLLRAEELYPMTLPRASGVMGHPGYEQYEACIRYVMDRVPPHERIFVGNTRHDRVTRNDEMFYFLSERDSATRHHQLHPGITTTRQVQLEIIDDIRRQGVRYVVLVNLDAEEPNDSGKSSGILLLDEYLRANFLPSAQFGIWTVCSRKDG